MQSPKDSRRTSNAITESPPQPTKERLKWPKKCDTKVWSMFDEDLDKVLEAAQAGSAERKVDSLTAITYSLAKERFGTVPRKENKDRRENQEKRKKDQTT